MLKRVVVFMISLVLLISLNACSNQKQYDQDGSEELIVEKQEGDYKVKLIANKGKYSVHEKINIEAQVKYIGAKDEVLVEHGGFIPVSFEVVEHTRNITIPSVEPSILSQTTFKREQWYTFKFDKSGEMKEDKFYEEYFNQEGFPKGQYTIKATFSFQSDEEDQYDIAAGGARILIGSIDIKVD